jgi:NifU-like protein involved in Fe-S cluster formation
MTSPRAAEAAPRVREHFAEPRNVGSFGRAAAGVVVGQAGSPERAALLRLELKLEGERIAATRFKAFGCGYTIACGSFLSELVRGKSLAQARALAACDVYEPLELPDDKRYTAELALEALKAALAAAAIQETRHHGD